MAQEPIMNLVLDALEDLLTSATGAPDYHNDYSGDGVVIFGEKTTNPSTSPCQIVIGPTALGADDTLTNIYLQGRTANIYFYVMYSGDAGDYKERLKATHRIADDIARACSVKALRDAVDAIDSGQGQRIIEVDIEQGAFTGLPERGLGSLALQYSITFDRRIVGTDGGI